MPYEGYYVTFIGRVGYRVNDNSSQDAGYIHLRVNVHAAGLEDAISRAWIVLKVMIGGTYNKDSFTLKEAKILE